MLHTPQTNDRVLKNYTKDWQEKFWEITLWLQKNYTALLATVPEDANHLNAIRAYLPHPGRVDVDMDIIKIQVFGG